MGYASVPISALREEHNLNIAKIARRLGVSRPYLSNVLHGRKKTKWARRAIAAACGLRPEQIWPEEKAS
jgi:transcriptional regulator with XRE-family HTH domain